MTDYTCNIDDNGNWILPGDRVRYGLHGTRQLQFGTVYWDIDNDCCLIRFDGEEEMYNRMDNLRCLEVI